jgi:hypothetical protein
MVNSNNNKKTESKQETTREEFMPHFSKEKEPYKTAFITDPETKKKTEQTFPRLISSLERAYLNWLEKVTNPKTGEYYSQRDSEGNRITGTTAKYAIKVIMRVRTRDKKEHLVSKGYLRGFTAAGEPENRWIIGPEKWQKANMIFKRVINEKTLSFDTECQGVRNVEDQFELPFSPENIDKLMEQAEPGPGGEADVQLIVKDEVSGDAKEVKWSSPKESLRLFKEKSFESLMLGEYIPLPVRQELRAKAEQEGLIPKTYPQTTTPTTKQKTGYLA